MALPLTDLIAGVFAPAVDLIDELHTSKEEKLQAKISMVTASAAALDKALTYERGILEARAGIVQAEAKSDHWLTATWRPIVMLFFTALVGLDSFGLLASPLSEEAWFLLKLGLGGYVVGRSAEKITKVIKG